MKKLLINGGGHSEIPLILAAKSLGFFTVTTGTNQDGLGHNFSDKYIYADFSNKEQIKQIIKNENIDFAIPACNDFSILTLSAINMEQSIGVFDDFEITKRLHHKTEFKKIAKELNLSVADSVEVTKETILEKLNLNYPLIVKPIDLSGGKGVTEVKNLQELRDAVDIALKKSREDTVLVEEFIDGTHHSCSTLIKSGKIVLDFFANEYFYKNRYLVEGAYSNFNLQNSIKEQILKDVEKLTKALNLSDGLIHTQFIIKNGRAYILEITRRSPGDLYLDLVSHSLDIDFATKIIQLHTDSTNFDIEKTLSRNIILRHCLMADRDGKIANIEFDKSLKDAILKKLLWYKKAETVDDFLNYKAGIIFAKFDSLNEVEDSLKEIHNLIRFEWAE